MGIVTIISAYEKLYFMNISNYLRLPRSGRKYGIL